MTTYISIPIEEAEKYGIVAEEKPAISDPSAAISHAMNRIGKSEQENFLVIFLSTRNTIIDSDILYKGSKNMSIIKPGEVFREAIKINAAGIIIAHNHPSGNPNPSPEDLEITKTIIKAGELLDIPVLDHVIVSPTGKGISIRQTNITFGWK